MAEISSLTNPKIKAALKLKQKKYRNLKQQFLVEGHHLITEAERAGLLVEVFTTLARPNAITVTPAIIQKLAQSKTPQGIIGVCNKPNYELKGQKFLLLDQVQDPGNVGTLIRSAKAFKWDAVIVKGADIYNFKTISASQGAIFQIPVLNILDVVAFLKKQNLPIVGAMLNRKALVYNQLPFKDKMVLIIGNEGQGISPQVQACLNYQVYIPINFESLNAAIAGSILLNAYQ